VNRVRTHTLSSGDTEGLVAQIVQARSEETDRVLLTYEGGYAGFWLARGRDPDVLDIAVVMCDPVSFEVGRWAKVAKTDRMDARRMVRALAAWDRGEAGALFRVRIPPPEEDDAQHLMRHRDRLVPTRTRINNTIRGLRR